MIATYYRDKMKRQLDFFFASLFLLFFFWLLVLIAIIIKGTSKGSILFKQKRIGLYKKPFYILKFRTMRIDTPKDVPTHLLKNPEQYITPIGRFLRKTSLDELPQIFNIIWGDMSIVGPRPALWNQFDLVAERDSYGANDVRPGLTGLAQVCGRDELPIKEKAALDGAYMKKMSLFFDISCIFRTIGTVWRREGVKEGGTNGK